MKLQDFRFNKSQYERPNQKKICGWSKYGKPCQIGPNAKGECQAQFECVPYKDKDRWFCTRPSNAGGKCTQGPSPAGECCNRTPRCVPVSTLRVKRGKFSKLAVVIMLILVFGFLSSSLRDNLINPGELSSHHNFEGIECNTCHVDSKNSSFGWIANVFGAHTLEESNAKCVACHDMGSNAGLAHSVSKSELESFRSVSQSVEERRNGQNIVSCASCHQEHKGLNEALTNIQNSQCETCHQQSHDNFESTHTEFSSYPFSRRAGIIFDHGNHISDYFKKQKFENVAPDKCGACHVIDAESMTMSIKSFDSSCSSCHIKDTTGEKLEEKGFAVVGLPAIDVASLSAANLHIGQWPDSLEDEEMPSLMIMLLSSDRNLHLILNKVSLGEVELFDLSDVDRATLTDVQNLVWSIKSLLHDFASNGQAALSARFEKALNKKLDEKQRSALVASMPVDLLYAAQKSWLPGLQKEISLLNNGRYSRSKLLPARELPVSEDTSNEDWMSAGGWYSQGFNIYYRSTGHEDRFLRTLLSRSDEIALKSDSISKRVFASLIDTKSPGQCTKCHSVDVKENNYNVNWTLEDSNPAIKLTHFKHQSHFSLMGDSGCKSCHALSDDSDFLTTYMQQDPSNFNPSWQQIEKQTCAQCHNKGSGIDSCTTCHEYHALPVNTSVPDTSFKALEHSANKNEAD